jgi:hypothetical protein
VDGSAKTAGRNRDYRKLASFNVTIENSADRQLNAPNA